MWGKHIEAEMFEQKNLFLANYNIYRSMEFQGILDLHLSQTKASLAGWTERYSLLKHKSS